jgi:hypothetical protein
MTDAESKARALEALKERTQATAESKNERDWFQRVRGATPEKSPASDWSGSSWSGDKTSGRSWSGGREA